MVYPGAPSYVSPIYCSLRCARLAWWELKGVRTPMPSDQWKREVEHVMGAGSMAEAKRRLSGSMFVICGDGYNGVADTLDEAHALALRMDGGTVYVKVDLVEHILAKMDTVVDKAHRIAVLEAALTLALEQLALDADGSPCSCEGETCRYCQARAALG
jgi:hypothetical protein